MDFNLLKQLEVPGDINPNDLKLLTSYATQIQNGKIPRVSLEEKNKKNTRDILLLVGPESGFMPEELALAVTHSFFKAKLTQGILRALQAVAVSLGIIRSR